MRAENAAYLVMHSGGHRRINAGIGSSSTPCSDSAASINIGTSGAFTGGTTLHHGINRTGCNGAKHDVAAANCH